MKQIKYPLTFFFLTVIGLSCSVTTSRKLVKCPQARPVYYLVLAVRENNYEEFIKCFSKEYQNQLKKEPKDELMEVYRKVINLDNPKMSPEVYKYFYTGTPSQGRVKITMPDGRDVGQLKVIKEKGEWKINDR